MGNIERTAPSQLRRLARLKARQRSTEPEEAIVDPLRERVAGVREYHYRVVRELPHDTEAFTQGLAWHEGVLLESTGLYGGSEVRRLSTASGAVQQCHPLAEEFFGEGMCVRAGLIHQLTWREQRILTYRAEDLRPVAEHAYPAEGWGLAVLGQQLVCSDGSGTLSTFEPGRPDRQPLCDITYGGAPLPGVNDMTAVGGRLFANVFTSDCIVEIEPRSGAVIGRLDLGTLLPRSERPNRNAVLNGITYDPRRGTFWVTGKLWPRIFEIRLLYPQD